MSVLYNIYLIRESYSKTAKWQRQINISHIINKMKEANSKTNTARNALTQKSSTTKTLFTQREAH